MVPLQEKAGDKINCIILKDETGFQKENVYWL
jgi:hypothetical protein